MIFRNLIWFSPKILPIIEEKIIIKDKNNVISKLYIKRIIGAIFCQVNIRRQFIQFNPSITSGNQEWKGAAPIFIKRAEFIIINNKEFWGINSLKFKFIIIENIKILDVKAWAIKYFKADSEGYKFLLSFNRGIIERRLISKPIHILNQEYEEIVIKVPNIKEFKKRIL